MTQKHGRYRIERLDDDEAARVADALSSRVEAERTARLWNIDVGGQLFYVDRFDKIALARAAWQMAQTCRQRNLPVPEPVVLLEARRLGRFGTAFLVSRFIEGAVNLEDLWPRLDEASKARIEGLIEALPLSTRPPRHALLVQRNTTGESLWLTQPHRFLEA